MGARLRPFFHDEEEGRESFGDYSLPVYVNISRIDEEGTGVAFAYFAETNGPAQIIKQSAAIAMTPIYAGGSLIYQAGRTLLAPLYTTSCFAAEKVLGGQLFKEDRPFEFKDSVTQMGLSLEQLVMAPFYATALFLFGICSLFDQRTAAAVGKIERDWNRGVTRAEGFWFVRFFIGHGRQAFGRFEGGGGPSKLGETGFYFIGWDQPVAILLFENWELIEAASSANVVKEWKGMDVGESCDNHEKWYVLHLDPEEHPKFQFDAELYSKEEILSAPID
jgi:hypothetical protein